MTMPKMTGLAMLMVASLPAAARAQETPACGAGHLVTIDSDGAVSRGSKDRLRRAVEHGLPIRVGWTLRSDKPGVPDFSHWTDAGFVTLFEGETFAQIDDIQRQGPVLGKARVMMPAGANRWSGIIGTNGFLESHFGDGTEPRQVKMGSTWCVDARAAACMPQWRLLYRHGPDGAPIDGSKRALVDAVRRGAPLRLAWGIETKLGARHLTLEHTAEPVFLSVIDGDEVFVQLPEHIGQAAYHEKDKARFDKPGVMWRGLMGSDGTFDAVFVDRATGQEVRRLPQRAGIAWFAELPAPECDAAQGPITQAPVTLAIPNGVQRRTP
jgi:hypothetical protein